MFRQASRSIVRQTAVRAFPRATAPARRFISTATPTQKSRSWKSLAARVGLVGGIIYYYNTMDVFAEEPSHAVKLPETAEENEILPTIESVTEERQRKREAELAARAKAAEEAAVAEAAAKGTPGGVEELGQEADQQGAFNPETGEINWDCPCLGGMAHGPCGEEFKTAFSCFIFSEEDPKGMDCIDKFKDMQNCFRQYPEVYGAELTDQDDEDDVTVDELDQASPAAEASGPHSPEKVAENKRELGVVPPAYRPEGEEAENDKPVVDVLKKTGEKITQSN